MPNTLSAQLYSAAGQHVDCDLDTPSRILVENDELDDTMESFDLLRLDEGMSMSGAQSF